MKRFKPFLGFVLVGLWAVSLLFGALHTHAKPHNEATCTLCIVQHLSKGIALAVSIGLVVLCIRVFSAFDASTAVASVFHFTLFHRRGPPVSL
ncbi:MAG: hypothetical protein AB7F28_03675 [Candidatus Margulisiibacteriota bacterium]